MAIGLIHQYVSAIADDGNTSLVQPSNWNAQHTLTLATGKLLGRSTAGTGAVEEITPNNTLTLSGGTLSATTATTSQLGVVKPDGVTVTIAAGVISASGGAATAITVGSTSVVSGTTTRVLFDNAGVLGEYSITGTGNVVMSASPTLTGTITAAAFTGSGVLRTTNNTASTSTTTGSLRTPGGAGIGGALFTGGDTHLASDSLFCSGTTGNTGLWNNAQFGWTASSDPSAALDTFFSRPSSNTIKCSGKFIVGDNSNATSPTVASFTTPGGLGVSRDTFLGGSLDVAVGCVINSGVAIPAGGNSGAALLFSTTAGFGVFYGSGAPSVQAAQGSLYLRSDGSTIATRLYVNTSGSTTWTNFVSAT